MAALIALFVLLVSYVSITVISIRAVIRGYRQIGKPLLASHLLFLMFTVVMSFFAPTTKGLLAGNDYLALFLLGVNEELIKGMSLLFFCSLWLTRSRLSRQFLHPAIWSFAVLLSLLETTKLFTEPLLSSLLWLSDTLAIPDSYQRLPVTQYFTTTGVYFLASTAVTRIAIHFFLCWLFVWHWAGGQKFVALGVALLHGGINVLMLQLAISSSTTAMHIILMGSTYLLIGCSLAAWTLWVRKRSIQFPSWRDIMVRQ